MIDCLTVNNKNQHNIYHSSLKLELRLVPLSICSRGSIN